MVLVADHLLAGLAPAVTPEQEAPARRALRLQVARLERLLSDALVTGFPAQAVDVSNPSPLTLGGPRLLGLGELEALRDQLAERLRSARAELAARADRQGEARRLLEAMHADPAAHRFARLPRAELGVPGCGNYEVRPRLGLVGMLMGWWQVKLSSGCPSAGRGEPASLSSDRHGPPLAQAHRRHPRRTRAGAGVTAPGSGRRAPPRPGR